MAEASERHRPADLAAVTNAPGFAVNSSYQQAFGAAMGRVGAGPLWG
jgi:hypothetical protein